VEGVVFRGVDVLAVDSEKYNGGLPSESFVAVEEVVIGHQ
jgi:hypothetical protein